MKILYIFLFNLLILNSVYANLDELSKVSDKIITEDNTVRQNYENVITNKTDIKFLKEEVSKLTKIIDSLNIDQINQNIENYKNEIQNLKTQLKNYEIKLLQLDTKKLENTILNNTQLINQNNANIEKYILSSNNNKIEINKLNNLFNELNNQIKTLVNNNNKQISKILTSLEQNFIKITDNSKKINIHDTEILKMNKILLELKNQVKGVTEKVKNDISKNNINDIKIQKIHLIENSNQIKKLSDKFNTISKEQTNLEKDNVDIYEEITKINTLLFKLNNLMNNSLKDNTTTSNKKNTFKNVNKQIIEDIKDENEKVFNNNKLKKSNQNFLIAKRDGIIRKNNWEEAKVIGNFKGQDIVEIKSCNDLGWCELKKGGFIKRFHFLEYRK